MLVVKVNQQTRDVHRHQAFRRTSIFESIFLTLNFQKYKIRYFRSYFFIKVGKTFKVPSPFATGFFSVCLLRGDVAGLCNANHYIFMKIKIIRNCNSGWNYFCHLGWIDLIRCAMHSLQILTTFAKLLNISLIVFSFMTEFCLLDAKPGACRNLAENRWYYNKLSQECNIFPYTGCHGNKNNFETRELCQQTCSRKLLM